MPRQWFQHSLKIENETIENDSESNTTEFIHTGRPNPAGVSNLGEVPQNEISRSKLI